MSGGSYKNVFTRNSTTPNSFDKLAGDASHHKAKPVNLHHSQLVCVKPPAEEPAKEKPRQKEYKRQPMLVKDNEKLGKRMTPSQFLAELRQSTEERRANTYTMHLPHRMKLLEVDKSWKKQCHVSKKEPLFQPFPSEMYFQNFTPMETYHLPLVLRNKDVVSHFIRVTQLDSPYFRVMSPASEGDKVGPGISVTFDVYFLPDEYKDYEHELRFITERESFVVPIHAIGARAFLDFPDSVNFSSCPVKHPASRTLFLRNIGNRDAKFFLKIEKSGKGHDSFSVSPEIYNLAINDTMQVSIQFYPKETGNYHGKLVIAYNTGEKVYVCLYGAAHDVSIQLNKKSLHMDGTYVSKTTKYSVTIHNHSDIISHFHWTQFATQVEEDQQKLLYHIEMRRNEQREMYSFLEDTKRNPKSADKVSALSRSFQNKCQAVSNRPMLFEDEVIQFDPIEGELWPKSSIDVDIIFKPSEAVHYTRVAFCDVSGRQSRLPLRIHGDGFGAKLDFSFEELDMGSIVVGSENIYELVVWNKGDIDGTYTILPNFSNFGPAFDFEPSDGKILAGGYQAIRVVVFSTKLGNICEHFFFQLDKTAKKKEVVFKGSVIAPTFRFSVPQLDFDVVSYGFPYKRTFFLINTSLVPISFRLRVPSDGSLPSIPAMGELDSRSQSPIPVCGRPLAKAFNIQPASGCIAAQSSTEVEVTLMSNYLRKFNEMMVVDVENVGRDFQGLPFRASCIIPHITVLTPEVDFGRCCLRYPCQKMVRLWNDSDWPAAYIVPPQELPQGDPHSILYCSPQPRGVVAPHSTQNVPIEIQVQKVDEQEVLVTIVIFGSDRPPLSVLLKSCGEGAVVHLDPDHLDWGNIPVLQSVSKTLLMSNQSKIPSYYTAAFSLPTTPFQVEPEEGEIPPESSSEIVVTAYLDDCLSFQSHLLLYFQESDKRQVPLHAVGEGTTIVSSPPLLPIMDLGPNFCKRPLVKTFTLTNKGRRHHQISWSTEGFSFFNTKRHQGSKDSKKSSKKGKGKSQGVDCRGPIFSVRPAHFSLNPEESIIFTLKACVPEPQTVSEALLCQAILGNSGNKEVIMKISLSAVFVCPILQFSTKSVLFHVEKEPKDKLNVQEQILEFGNVSSLPLSITMALRYPFSMCVSDKRTTECMELYLPHQERHKLVLCFDPHYKTDLHTRTIDDVLTFSYKEHSQVDKIPLRGEVYFPNLEFEKMDVNFGCILNDTEVTRHVKMKNISPLQVKYRWSFFLDPTQHQVRRICRPKIPTHFESVEHLGAEQLGTEQPGEEQPGGQPGEQQGAEQLEQQQGAEQPGEQPGEQLGVSTDQQEPQQRESVDGGMIAPTSAQQLEVNLESDKENTKSEEQDVQTQMEISHTPKVEKLASGARAPTIVIKQGEDRGSTECLLHEGAIEELVASEDVLGESTSSDEFLESTGKDLPGEMEKTNICIVYNQLALGWTEAKALYSNHILSSLMDEEASQQHPLGVEEVFDIMPLYGHLNPGENELVAFTFFGHANILGEVKAVCEVEGGPNYELMVSGEASLVEYHFEVTELDFGKQLYDTVGVKELKLVNTGRVAFSYYALDIQPVNLDFPKPGQPELVPYSGTMDPFGEQKLQVWFLPGVPGPFSSHFSVQVAHFEPDVIHIFGEGVFPRISLDLPRSVSGELSYQCLLREACKNLMPTRSNTSLETFANACLQEYTGGPAVADVSQCLDTQLQNIQSLPTSLDVQLEVERLTIRNFALEKVASASHSAAVPEEDKSANAAMESSHSARGSWVSNASMSEKKDVAQSHLKKHVKPRLPKYLLDFGFVVLGTQRTRVVHATNTGWYPVSFRVKRGALGNLGFGVGLDKVHQLPGAPDNETVDFVVTFDPKAACLPIGPVEVNVPIDIFQGPVVELCLRAHVTMPSLQLSHASLDFQDVKCGECRIIIIQIHNNHQVPGPWTALYGLNNKTESLVQNGRHTPLHLRRKAKVVRKVASTFEVFPSSGVLQPGQRVNLQVKFTPTEQTCYEETIHFKIAQSSQRLPLVCQGQGLEPRLEFISPLMEFSPILPYSTGDTQTLVINNPCSFPVEFYCLELDGQYLEEEKMLRHIPGYSELNFLLLPPRNPGDKLPNELLEYYKEYRRRHEEEDTLGQQSLLSELANRSADEDAGRKEQVEVSRVTTLEPEDTEEQSTEPVREPATPCSGVGQIESNPVLEAVANYLGVDITDEGKAASNRCGLAIIIHGSPLSGKTFTAIQLAQLYNAAVLTLDGVVTEAITSGSSLAALNARELCEEAGCQWAEELKMQEEHHLEGVSADGVSVATHHSPHEKGVSGSKTTLVSEGFASSQSPGGCAGGYHASRLLSFIGSNSAQDNMASCLLPEDLLVEILVERLELEDCRCGVVFDGLETLFASSTFTAANSILRALNNRRYIFFCTLRLEYTAFLEQEREHQEEKERHTRQLEDLERQKIQDMDEDEYDALSPEEREHIDQIRLTLKKKRRKREQEERERKEREREEERRKEEELKSRKNTKKKLELKRGGSEPPEKKDSHDKRDASSVAHEKPQDSIMMDVDNHSELDHPKKKKHGKDGKKDNRKTSLLETSTSATPLEPDPVKEAELNLLKRFRAFENAHRDLCDLLVLWDRTTLQLRHSPGLAEHVEEEPAKKGKGKGAGAEKKQPEKEHFGTCHGQISPIMEEPADATLEGEIGPEEELGQVPHIQIDCFEYNGPAWQRILDRGLLPSKQEVLEGMGMGPEGPPIPPPTTLSVVTYPPRRKPCPQPAQMNRFVFLDDLSSAGEEKVTEPEVEEEKTETIKRKMSNRCMTYETPPSKGKDRKKSQPKQETAPPVAQSPSFVQSLEKVSTFRYVVPAHGQKALRIFFSTDELGQYEQIYRFEIVGTRRQYQVVCRGACAFPTISREPRIVFSSRKKMVKENEIVHKKYIHATQTFEFGPVLMGKIRERAHECDEDCTKEYCETLHIHNPSGQVAEVTFCLLHESSSTFQLDCTAACLNPGETQPLVVTVSPTTLGRFEDAVVCCIRENPEPVMFTIACDVVRPELTLDKKQFHFDRVLVHRKDTKVIFLRNPTMLPVSWRLVGLENLGDDFTVGAESGVLEPLSEYPLTAYFRALKPMQTSKKSIRLEVSDVEDALGVVQSEPIQILAEAYDVSLDMNLSKGPNCGIDFGLVRVHAEMKEIITLKNKGRYETVCTFEIETDDPKQASLFTFSPNKVSLVALDKHTQVVVTCKCPREVEIHDMPLFKCYLSDPLNCKQGEWIATIPIKVTVKSVYSKFTILPSADISFGYLLVNAKKTRTLTIQNDGAFEFRFSIFRKSEIDRYLPLITSKILTPIHGQKTPGKRASSTQRGSQAHGKKDARLDIAGGRITAGMFSISPSADNVTPGNTYNVTIDCTPDKEGKAVEELVIVVSESDPREFPMGIPYKVLAEACTCSINVDDVASVFEEHHICKNLSQIPSEIESGGVYGEEEKRFVFNHVLVGSKAKARFKISNTSKVPCDVSFTLKPVPQKGVMTQKQVEAFEVEPLRSPIAAHSFVFATISFTPPCIQAFNAMFDAAIEGMRAKTLVFEVAGEGTLPRVSITRPSVRNSNDQPLLLFNKILVGRSQALPLTVFNNGLLPCKVDMFLMNSDETFTLHPADNLKNCDDDDTKNIFNRKNFASVILEVGEKTTLKAVFRPQEAEQSQAFMKLSVVDNEYENCLVELVGEGHQDDITIDNVTCLTPADIVSAFSEGSFVEEDESGAESRQLVFGDCPINCSRTLTFSITNHSPTNCVRFSWPSHALLSFSPQVGHLHASCTKDIMVTFVASAPVTLTEEVVMGRVAKIQFNHPMDQVTDWDDRVKAVKWADVVQDPQQGKSVRPLKRKVVELETELCNTELAESVCDIQLMVSALADYACYSCDTSPIHFKDTLLFQTRFYQLTLENSGAVTLNYRWQVTMEQGTTSAQSSVTTLPRLELERLLNDVGDRDSAPFSVDPAWGSVPPGKAAVLKVNFSPLDVGEFVAFLTCSISNLAADTKGPVIRLHGCSLLPVCHFDLEESDYISAMRRDPELPGPNEAPPGSPLDPSTRVVECHALGVGVVCPREFNIINPTNNRYNYEWVCEDSKDQRSHPAFKCLYLKGHIDSGRRVKVGFKFVSTHLGIVESFWRFNVASENISIPFLLVGHAREPSVFFNRSHVTFDPLLIGEKKTKTVYLINKESTAFSFQFVEKSCHNEGFASSVTVDPLSGQMAANSRIAVKISFVPTQEKEVTFNIICKIQYCVSPLMLNVKVEGYTMNCKLFCEDSTGKRVQLSARGINQINFGNVQIQEKALRQLSISNLSKFSLSYGWELAGCAAAVRQGLLQVQPHKDIVQSGSTAKCMLTFCPTECVPLRDCQLSLKIIKGPTFSVSAVGQGVLPGLQLSFQTYNFGYTFVQFPGEPPPTATLTLSNGDTKDISVCCLYTPTPQLHHSFEACVLGVGKSVSIPFTFHPPEAGSYKELVIFEVNGISQRTVEFLGTGCDAKVEVADKKHKLVAVGSCFVGDVFRSEIPIVNRSPAPITFQLNFSPISPHLQCGPLWVTPTGPVTLAASGGSLKVDILFKPKSRVPSFSEQVFMQFGSVWTPLFTVSGTCLGMDVVLDTRYVPFGTIFLHGQTSRNLVMTNHGDINTRFRWDANSMLPDFSIVPVEGYITPGMEVTFELKFHPQESSADIRHEDVHCFLDGGPHSPMLLTLTGSCTNISPMKDVYNFSTVVRGKDTKSIPISNRTMTPWHLTPIIEGSQWSGPPTLTVEQEQTRNYDITYQPLTMTTDCKHSGTVFFPFPDGLGQLYYLVGTAEAPKPSSRVVQEVPCKTDYTQLLSVHNWMTKSQRFHVKIDVAKAEKMDPSLKITNMDYIYVPANSHKLYKFQIYAYREGQLQLKVTFTHEPSGEYLFHEVQLRFTKPGVISVIDLSTAVRHTLHHKIAVDNPLNLQVTLNASCSVPEINLFPSLVLPPLSKGYYYFDYLPLKVGEVQGKLELCSPDLGLFLYDLVLRATPPSPEKPVHMRVALGQNQVQTVRFMSYTRSKTEYTLKVDSTDFQVDKCVIVNPSPTGCTEATVDVTFEPSRLGEQSTMLTISSPVGGDYVIPLLGSCTDPTPQGPIFVKAGGTGTITFRNVFFSFVTFNMQVDNPQFRLQKESEVIRSKKDQRILLQLDAIKDFKGPMTGRLVISCQSPTDKTSSIQWVYYLKGFIPKKDESSTYRLSIDGSDRR